MTEPNHSLDPQQLTSFSNSSSPSEGKSNLLQYVLDFIKRPENVSTVPEASNPKEPPKTVSRKVTTFESVKKSISFPQPSFNNSSADDIKKYWMPDDQCKECYECGAVFNTFRRRHHCRLCGQIFCYECCSDMISGKITGYGDAEVQLRVCKYCLELKSKSMNLERRQSVSQGLIFSPNLERQETQSPCHDQYNSNIQEELNDEDVWHINLHIMWSLFRSPESTARPQPLWNKFRYYSEAYYLKDIETWLKENLQKPSESEKMISSWVDTERLTVIDNNRTMFKAGPKDDFNENTVHLYEQIRRQSQDISTNWIERLIQEVKDNSQIFDINNVASISSFVHIDTKKDLDDEYWNTSDPALSAAHNLDDINGFEIKKTVDSMNKTLHLLQTPEYRRSDELALEYGVTLFEKCGKEELQPTPGQYVHSGDTPPNSLNDLHSESIKNLYHIYDRHMESILDELIEKERIPIEWSEILRKIVSQAAADVTPNPMNGDSMDVRRYVKFKKVLGKPDESEILDGYVFSKTISHKKMRSDIQAPRIMLLSGSISYQRVLNKLTSLNPVFLQEREFLSKSVDRIASFQPDILIVEKSVSQIAKNELLEKGITLILNLKSNQIDKIARIVQGDIFQNLDNISFIPASGNLHNQPGQSLGFCERFYCKFLDGFHGLKPLLFFTGCEKHLGKTIILKGPNKIIMKRVKKVAQNYLYALYNKRLETQYLRKCVLRLGDYPINALKKIEEEFQESNMDDEVFEAMEAKPSDDAMSHSSTGSTIASEYSAKNKRFEELVDTSIFSVTPFCRPGMPFLKTLIGNLCPTRNYFEEEIYYSPLLLSPDKLEREQSVRMKIESEIDIDSESVVSPKQYSVIGCNSDDLAFYRAYGYWEFEKEKYEMNRTILGEECITEAPNRIRNRLEQNKKGKDLDCLDFYNHQKLIVLFSSFSKQSLNHPNPCISPWSLSMQYYGKNDLTLGIFLRDYCFQSSYECPNQSCKTEIISHDRRFVHAGQCVDLREVKLSTVVEDIAYTPIMWNVCSICLYMSDINVVSKEVWNFSFAKFLELKFYERSLYPAGSCDHAFHQYHTNFFALGNIVAVFQRSDVNVMEVVPLVREYDFSDNLTEIAVGNGVLLNETVTKINSTIRIISDKIKSFSNGGTVDEATLNEARSRLNAEDLNFKQSLAMISLETETSGKENAIDIRRKIFQLQSDLVFCIDWWNKHLLGLMKGRNDGSSGKKKHRSSKTFSNGVSSDFIYNLVEPERECSSSAASSPSPQKPPEITVSHVKVHRRRSHSDSFLLQKRSDHQLNKTHSRSQEFEVCQDSEKACDDKQTLSEDESEESTDESKTSDPKFYNRFAIRTKRFFAAITESYKRIEIPFPLEMHHRITGGSRPAVLVNERHFTSIIAYALSSDQYRAKVQLIKSGEGATSCSNAPENKVFKPPPIAANVYEPDEFKIEQSGHWMNVHNSSEHLDPNKQAGNHKRNKSADMSANEIHKHNHVDIEFQDGPTKFFCKIYFAAEFERLRGTLMPGDSLDDFIFSMSMCNKWKAKGGKSGLAFSKTQDDRWVVKEMSRLELQALLMFMPNYVEYVMHRLKEHKPTLLAKIVGAFTVGFSNSHSGASLKQDVIIMENIFYGATPSLVFDLKGSFRNRLVEDFDEVLLDENLLRHITDTPVYLRPHSKTFLRDGINCDTAFLAAQSIIDYSLLVGLSDDKLYVGIIDYIRKFTFDKKVEMIVKSGYSATMPTIVSPEIYKDRFCSQLERYFPLIPDKWTGMGADLYYST